jgi:hypothetical protein
MLITFKSSAGGDVIMFGEVARLMLVAIGKDPEDARGIITVEQLPGAMQALRAAMEQDKAAHAGGQEGDDSDKSPGKEPFISFSKRALPLVDLMTHSIREKTPVIWEG